jgi:hypothetical protein
MGEALGEAFGHCEGCGVKSETAYCDKCAPPVVKKWAYTKGFSDYRESVAISNNRKRLGYRQKYPEDK